MKEIRITPGTQVVTALALVVGIGAIAATQYPEIQRYMKIKSM